MNVMVPVLSVLYFVLGNGAPPSMGGFEDIIFMFVSLFQMFWPLILLFLFIALVTTVIEVVAPGSTLGIRSIFRLGGRGK